MGMFCRAQARTDLAFLPTVRTVDSGSLVVCSVSVTSFFKDRIRHFEPLPTGTKPLVSAGRRQCSWWVWIVRLRIGL